MCESNTRLNFFHANFRVNQRKMLCFSTYFSLLGTHFSIDSRVFSSRCREMKQVASEIICARTTLHLSHLRTACLWSLLSWDHTNGNRRVGLQWISVNFRWVNLVVWGRTLSRNSLGVSQLFCVWVNREVCNNRQCLSRRQSLTMPLLSQNRCQELPQQGESTSVFADAISCVERFLCWSHTWVFETGLTAKFTVTFLMLKLVLLALTWGYSWWSSRILN